MLVRSAAAISYASNGPRPVRGDNREDSRPRGPVGSTPEEALRRASIAGRPGPDDILAGRRRTVRVESTAAGRSRNR